MCVCEWMLSEYCGDQMSCSSIFSALLKQNPLLYCDLHWQWGRLTSPLVFLLYAQIWYKGHVSSLYACPGDRDPDLHYFRASAWTQWPISRHIDSSSFTGKHCTLLMHLITREQSLLFICVNKNNRNYRILSCFTLNYLVFSWEGNNSTPETSCWITKII